MICPACRSDLVIVEVEGVDLDVCPKCQGTWFDADELGILFESAGLPAGTREVEGILAAAASEPSPARRRCPRCRRRLLHTAAVPPPRELFIDRCPRGDGLWFDAGELQAVLEAGIPAHGGGLERIREFLGRFAAPRTGSAPRAPRE